MARYSKSAKGLKLEHADIVSVQSVKGKVESIQLIKGTGVPVGVLVEVDFTRGTGATNFLNLSDIDAVRVCEGAWVDLKGQPVEV